MGVREDGKDSRRRIILKVARELISGQEKTSFTMRALSEHAGMSITTPYNLFGSKQAIMQALLDEDIAAFARDMQASARNELDMLFEAVSLGVKAFAANASYYRAVMDAVYREGGRQYRSSFRTPRRLFWRRLVEDAVGAGYLSRKVDAESFSVNLAGIFFFHILEWVAGEIDLPELQDRTHYGFALALLGFARPRHVSALRRQALAAQRRLAAPERAPGAARRKATRS